AGQPLELEADGWEVTVGPGADGLTVVDPSPLVARVVAERDRGTSVPAIAAAFHVGLGNAVADVAADLASTAGVGAVALSGGVFQNARLTEIVERRLTGAGLEVLVHSKVPPNDGGVSVGQAAVAARREL
ncbi:MAG: hydrogenase maturation protein HypF, partial [Actinomycetota bacterium]|nr:hydrogenase maturation protein HypF [Actinomycetota bacterium]